MQYALLSCIAFLTLTSASPVELRQGISIPLHKRNSLVRKDGVVNATALRASMNGITMKYAATLQQFEANMGHPNQLAGAFFSHYGSSPGKRASGADALTDYGNALWYGSVNVGTPPKTFTVDFDTGSSDFFLPSSNCTTCGSHHTYNSSASSTSKSLGKSFSLKYGDGSTTSGTQYNDTVSIAGLTAVPQTLGDATSYSSEFKSAPMDGVMGMGWPALSSFSATPFMFNLYGKGTLSTGEFAMALTSSAGELYLGGVDSSKYTGSFSYTPVTQKAYWQVTTQSLTINGTSLATNQVSILDSGSSLLILDLTTAKNLYAKITGAALNSAYGSGVYTAPCAAFPSSVVLTIGGKAVTIPSTVLNYGQIAAGSVTCVGGIAGANYGFWILGDTFMRNVYTVFDIADARVGFATPH